MKMNRLQYKTDGSGNRFLEIPFGWNAPNELLRITYVEPYEGKPEPTIRLQKTVDNHPYQGPEPEFKNIPLLAEVLLKIYNDFKQ